MTHVINRVHLGSSGTLLSLSWHLYPSQLSCLQWQLVINAANPCHSISALLIWAKWISTLSHNRHFASPERSAYYRTPIMVFGICWSCLMKAQACVVFGRIRNRKQSEPPSTKSLGIVFSLYKSHNPIQSRLTTHDSFILSYLVLTRLLNHPSTIVDLGSLTETIISSASCPYFRALPLSPRLR